MIPNSTLLSAGSAIIVLTASSLAQADSFGFASQTGQVGASGSTQTLGTGSQNAPISDLADADEMVAVEDGDPGGAIGSPPGYYNAVASLQTTLSPNEIHVIGETTAEARWDGSGNPPDGDATTKANADANLTILFDLASPKPLRFQSTGDPFTLLEHQSLGFAIGYAEGGPFIEDCGSLDAAQCDALVGVFFSGATVPGGSYMLSYDIFAFQPFGSCNVGCNSMGGTATLSIIPEPSTGFLLSAGLLALGMRRFVPAR